MKKEKETLQQVMKEMADECKASGHNNLAIVLYSYLGAEKCGMDGYFAEHCQKFVTDGIKEIKKLKNKHNN